MIYSFLSRIIHWGPLIALGIIQWVSLSTIYCITINWNSSHREFFNLSLFLFLTSCTMYHFLCAVIDGPGFLPLGWTPKLSEDKMDLQYCSLCKGYKAPRSHHCRKCGRCVLKMDHHCPWINNCVGHHNHGHFIGFLTYAVLGCAQATYILTLSIYYGLNRPWYIHYGTGSEPIIHLTLWSLLIIMFGLGLAIGVVLAVGALLFFQLRSVLRNQTGIEDWILEKAFYRHRKSQTQFQHPYSLGYWENIRQVLSFSCVSSSNGIDWKIRKNSHKYDLTREQLEQKKEKRFRTIEYKIIKSYSGSWVPLCSHGFRVTCHPPCTDEQRIRVSVGETVSVTRWKKYWLYGHSQNQLRGWFPRKCAGEEDIKDNIKKKE